MAAADSDTTGTSLRSPAERSRTFAGILVNTALANITTSYLWFALTFWLYLETRNVIATGVVGGAYMLLIALSSWSGRAGVFGFAMAFVPRHRPGLPGCRHHHDRRRPAGLPDSGLPPGFRFICAGGGGGEGRRLNTRTPPQQVRKRPGVQEGVERPIRPRLP